MKILLTGAGGFLGTEICRQLSVCNNVTLIALSSQEEKLKGLSSSIEVYSRDYIFEDSSICKDVDVLINCAFPRNVDGVNLADGLKYISSVLEIAVANGVGAVINISSQSVYSQKRLESANESTELNLESKYAIAKYAVELMTNTICKDIPHTNIRLASLIGVGFDQRIINKFIIKALNGEGISIVGGKQRFGFLDVRDAASGIIRVAESYSNFLWNEVYNLGAVGSYSLTDIAFLAVSVCEKNVSICVEESDEWMNSELDSDLIMSTFEWSPKYTLADTASDIVSDLLF